MKNHIQHAVIFNFKDGISPSQQSAFFAAAAELALISGVQNFQLLKQTSIKNPFAFGISMEFASKEAYEEYNHHPVHVQFIQNHWLKGVADFLEIDYEGME